MMVAGETCGEDMRELIIKYHAANKTNFKLPKFGVTWILNMFREGLGPYLTSQLIPGNLRKYYCSWIGTKSTNKDRIIMFEKFKNFCYLLPQQSYYGTFGALEYTSIVCDSIFVLVPWGRAAETIRLGDTLECGAIPIIRSSRFIEKLPKPLPWIVNDTWDQLYDTMKEILAKGPQFLFNLQNNNIIWWNKYKYCARKHIAAIIDMSRVADLQENYKT